MTKFAFFQDEIVPIEQAKISVMTQTFNYGTGCFAGIRGYWSEADEQLYVFRLAEHFQRFCNSAKMLLMDLPYSSAELVEITLALLAQEGWRQNCYIRPIAYLADETIAVRLHEMTPAVTIFTIPLENYLPLAGLHVGTSSWRRVDDTAIPARGKIIGSYANSSLIRSEAALNGFNDAIVLNQDGHVSEGSAANFAMFRDDALITTPVQGNILEGITRRTVIELCQQELGLPVYERSIDRSELYLAQEAFYCGTGAQIAPITRIDHRPVGDGEIGPLVRRLQELYFGIVRGENDAYRHWLTPVPVAASVAA